MSLVVVIADVAVLLAMLAAARSRRLLSVPAFWTGRFLPVLGAGLAVLLAVTWFQFGGLPRGYDTYGRVSVPGQRVLALPAGVVTLDFENGLNFAGTDNASEIHTPPGMVVRVTAVARPAAPLTVDRVPSWLFESDVQNYGHKPWGRIHIPTAGRYLLETGRVGDPLPSSPHPDGAAAPRSTLRRPDDCRPGRRRGRRLGSPLVGAILCGLVLLAAFCLPPCSEPLAGVPAAVSGPPAGDEAGSQAPRHEHGGTAEAAGAAVRERLLHVRASAYLGDRDVGPAPRARARGIHAPSSRVGFATERIVRSCRR